MRLEKYSWKGNFINELCDVQVITKRALFITREK